MGRVERIAELEVQLEAARERHALAAAQIRGLATELEALRAAPSDTAADGIKLTDAVLQSVADAQQAVGASDVQEVLTARRGHVPLATVSATLRYLAGQGKLVRVSRGRYAAG